MAGVKVAMVPSISGNRAYMVDRWVRETSYGSTWRAAAAPVAVETMAARTMTSVNLPGNNGERISVGWRLISCAQFGAAPRRGLFRKLGSRGQKAFFFSASFESKVRRPVATGMCSQNKVDRDDMDRSPPLSQNQPLHHIHQPQQLQPSRWLTLPTILTLGRVVAVPLLICTFYMNGWWGTTATTSIFIVAAITDWLDGYIARKMRLGTAFGAFLDPVADKLMVAATLVLLCNRPLGVAVFGDLPWLLTVPSIVIIGREITMSAVREWAASQNNRVLEAVAVNNLGKWKTATQMTALTILLATRDSSLSGSGILVSSGIVLLYVSAGLTIWSLVVYMSKIWRILLK